MKPPIALLADVDGPICNPDAKSITDARIIPALLSLLENNVPVVFNTGRSAHFVEHNVFAPLLARNASHLHLLHAVCEKGVVWISLTDEGGIKHHIDQAISVPPQLHPLIRELVDRKYASTMFYDETKESMVSVERRHDVDDATYKAAQAPFINDLEELIRENGYTYTFASDNSEVTADLQLDPSIISVDIESPNVGKDLGAARAYEMLQTENALPQKWWTIGDSRTDYAMAQWLHDRGESVEHVDVAAVPSQLQRSYAVTIPASGIHDDAGGAFVERLASEVVTRSGA